MSSLRVGLPSALCAALAAGLAASAACGRLGYDTLADGDGGSVPGPGTPDADLLPPDADPLLPDGGPGPADAAPADAPGPQPDASVNPTTEIPLTSITSNSEHPVLAFTGDGYEVVWDDDRGGNREIYLQRVAGGAAQGANVRLTQAAGYSGFPSVAWSGSELGVAWEDGRLNSDEIFFTRCDKNGVAIGPQSQLSFAAGLAYDPSVVWKDSNRFAVGWEDGGGTSADIYFAVTTPQNGPMGNPVRRSNSAGASLRSSVAWTGSEFGMAWEDGRGGNFQMFFARCAANSSPLGSDARAVTSTGRSLGASLVWNGSVYGLAYEDNRTGTTQVYVARLDASGVQLGNDVAVPAGSMGASEPSLAWASDHWAVAYVQSTQVLMAELTAQTLAPISVRIVSSTFAQAENPKLVWTGAAYGMVWQDRRAGNYDVYFREVVP